ncbi:MAG: T9SS type A sorting domain-containing protein, partial [candidate division WOR-3 bacterium]
AVFANKIYLLKGNNTLEIWRYDGEGISSPLAANREEREKFRRKDTSPYPILERRIYNILGKVIYWGKGKPALQPGIYFIEEGGRKERRKIVVVK